MSSRYEDDMEESIQAWIDASDSEESSLEGDDNFRRQSSSRSYDRYDTDQEVYSDPSADSGEESCSSSSSHLQKWTSQLRANCADFFRLELDDPVEAGVISLVEAIKANKTIREVEVHIDALEGLSKQDQSSLADAICRLPELRSFLVYKNSSAFLEPLSRHSPFLLRHLRLCKLEVTEPRNIDELAGALGELPNLSSLDVGFEAPSSNEVLRALSKLKSIYVNLDSFRVDYKLLQDVVEDCVLDDRIVSVIAQAVKQSETLKSLSLPPFGCTDQCHDTLIQLLHQNCVLERIDYWVRICNLYYPDANETIDHLLHLNRSGARLLMRKQGRITSPEVLQQVLSSLGDLDAIYYLFSSDPSLLGNAVGWKTTL